MINYKTIKTYGKKCSIEWKDSTERDVLTIPVLDFGLDYINSMAFFTEMAALMITTENDHYRE